MPKKVIKRYLPDHETIKEQRFLKLFGSLLHDPNLWHLNRRSAIGAFSLGLFWAFIPVPIQMWLSAICAIPLRVNIPLAVATVWITNPLTMGPIFYAVYKLGAWLIGAPPVNFEFELSIKWLVSSIETIGPAFLVGCGVTASIASIVGYFTLDWVWRYSVNRAWQKRRAQR